MRILVLGGTQFVGRAIVEDAIARGHELTLFNRGNTAPDLFPDVESLHGDRDGGLEPLRGRTWDVAIDCCGYVPRIVRASCELLADAVEHMTFVSTCSVYGDNSTPGQGESAALATLDDPSVEKITGETYGGLKVLCEQAVEAVFPERAFIVRPGLIVGPNDHTDRFTYWPVRLASYDRVLSPPAESIIEFTDARDLARFIVDGAEQRLLGAYNVSGPSAEKTTFRGLFEACAVATRQMPEIVYASAEFLIDEGVKPWLEVPLWMPPDQPGFTTRSIARALEAGFQPRPAVDTVRDTLEWVVATRRSIEAGLPREREEALLGKWAAR